jgi:hypothetical protein
MEVPFNFVAEAAGLGAIRSSGWSVPIEPPLVLVDSVFALAVRCIYRDMLPARRVLKPMSTKGVPAWHRSVIKGAYPLWRWVLAKDLTLGTTDAAVDHHSIQGAFDRVAKRLGAQPFLGGCCAGRGGHPLCHDCQPNHPATRPSRFNAQPRHPTCRISRHTRAISRNARRSACSAYLCV